MLKNHLVESIAKALQINGKDINLDYPTNDSFGDYTTNLAMILANKEGKKPREMADEFVKELKESKETSDLFEKIEVAGPGFINFYLKNDLLIDNLTSIDIDNGEYGSNKSLAGKKIIVEFTDPNPFKEFHIGHLYTNTVGEAISRILEASGANVKRANYQGDVGLHVAKAVWGLSTKMKEESLSLSNLEKMELHERVKFMGESYARGSSVYEEDEAIKEEINLLNKKIFEKDPEVMDLYQKGRTWSLEYFETIYKRLGTKFDFYYFESEVGKVGEEIVKEGLEKGIFEKSKGAIIFPGSKHGLHDRVFINSLGLPTYEAKELGLAPTKYKDFSYDQSIIITANEITEYFKVLIKAMGLIYPELGDKTMHIGHGVVKLPEGKMSSRTGKIVSGEGLLDQVKEQASKINEEVSEEVAVGALKYAFLRVGIGKDIVYDVNESLSLEGNSGPYLQYTYARTQSLLEKVEGKKELDKKTELNKEESVLVRQLIKFPEIVEAAAVSYSPSLVCNYLYNLASSFNSFYNQHKVIGSDEEGLRTLLTSAVGSVIKNGLNMLGVKTPKKM